MLLQEEEESFEGSQEIPGMKQLRIFITLEDICDKNKQIQTQEQTKNKGIYYW